LKEDPDMPDGRDLDIDDIQRLKNGGVSSNTIERIVDGEMMYHDDDAIPFTYFPKWKMGYYGGSESTHGEMFLSVRNLGTNHPEYFLGVDGDQIALETPEYGGRVKFIGASSDKDKIIEFSKLVASTFSANRPYGSSMPAASEHSIQGRLWPDDSIVSFWNKKDVVMPHLEELRQLFFADWVNFKHTAFEFIDQETWYSYDDLKHTHGTSRSDAEQKELLAKQHLDPEAKKALAGDDYVGQHMKKLGQGHDFAAIANAKKQTSDGVISTKKLVKENPDSIYLQNSKSDWPDLNYQSKDASPFIYNPELDLLFITSKGIGMTHYDILECLSDIKVLLENMSENGEEPIDYIRHGDKNESIFVDEHKKIIGGRDLTVSYVGTLEKLIHFLFYNMDEHVYGKIPYEETRVNRKLGIMGRIWFGHSVIAVWNDTKTVLELKRMGILKTLLNLLKVDLNKAQIGPGDSQEAVAFSTMGESDIKTMSAEEYKELLAKQHLDASAKKKLAGDEFVGQHMKKLAQGHDFAAQANAAKQTSDGVIKFGTLLKEDPEEVYIQLPSGKTSYVEYNHRDARSFLFHPTYNIFIIAESNSEYHYDIINTLGFLGRASMEARENNRQFYCKGIDIDGNRIITFNGSYVYHGTESNLLKFGEYMSKTDPNADLDDRSDVSRYGFFGRVWTDKNILSFWCINKWLDKMIEKGYIDKIISLTKLDKSKPLYIDFVDIKYASLYQDIIQGKTSDKKLSDKEVKALLAKQHLDPEAKKALSGDEYKFQHLKKQAQGHDFAAIANARKQTSDGIIRLKDLI
jgi:hypothetical protein